MAAKRRKKKTSGRSRKKQKDFEPFYKEIAVLIVFALFLFLFLSNFGICGYIGDSISTFLFGFFGTVHYIVPVAGLFLSLLLISNDYSSLAIKKTFFSILLITFIILFNCFLSASIIETFLPGIEYVFVVFFISPLT